MSRLRIYFDVSVLGDAWCNGLSRAGIARAADCLFAHLSIRRDVELIAFSSSGNERAAYHWLESLSLGQGSCYSKLHFGLISHVQEYCFRVESWMREKERKACLVPLVRSWRMLKNLSKFLRRGLLSSQHSRIVSEFRSTEGHSVYFSPVVAVPIRLRALPNVHYSVLIHDTIPILFPELCKGERTAEWYCTLMGSLGSFDAVFCVSESTRLDLLNVHEANENDLESKVSVLPLAADSSLFASSVGSASRKILKRYGLDTEQEYLLSLGTLEPRKNLKFLVEAFLSCVRKGKLDGFKLVLVGQTGWGNYIYGDCLNDPLLEGRVHFTGYVEDSHLASIYSNSTLFIFPSIYEGFGLPVLEAMQCGVPVLASNRSSLPEVGGDAACYFDPHDLDDLSDKIIKLCGDVEILNVMRTESSRRASRFTWENTVERLVDKLRYEESR